MKLIIRPLLAVATVLIVVSGCAKSNPDAPAYDGGHPSGWAQSHGAQFLSVSDQCRACHGDDLSGGIAGGESHGPGVSTTALEGGCFSAGFGATICHGNTGPFGHSSVAQIGSTSAQDWGSAHPSFAMAKPVGLVNAGVGPVASAPTGFVLCQKCHGTLYNRATFPGPSKGEVLPSSPDIMSCVDCHLQIFGISAPHSSVDAGWRTTHQDTNPDNAAACEICHRNQQNLSDAGKGLVSFSYNAAAPAGCFNNTLCHSAPNPHPDGWVAPGQHGVRAKAFPTKPIDGFLNCQNCHGPRFDNFTPGETRCVGCHHDLDSSGNPTATVSSDTPHPGAGWRLDGTYTHRTTDSANAPACAQCHSQGQNSPITLTNPAPVGTPFGCFNSTLCHASGVSPHPSGWASASAHGVAAVRTTPSASDTAPAGLINCRPCHGDTFRNFCAGQCHTPAHPNQWEGGHQRTLQVSANLEGCAVCHKGSRYGTTTLSCFNNTLCHANPD